MGIRNLTRGANANRIRENFVVYACVTAMLLAPIPLLWVFGDHDLLGFAAMIGWGLLARAAFMGIVWRGDWY